MSSARSCPSCTQINPTEASVCLACGTDLSPMHIGDLAPSERVIDLIHVDIDIDEDTVPAVHVDAPELQRWFDSRPDGADTASAPLDLTLRTLDELPVLDDVAPTADILPPGVVIRSDPAPGPRPTVAITRPPATKAARRAAVRRNRLSASTAPAGSPPADVLVLEHDDSAREQLCGLLEAFGFRAHPVHSAVHALRMLDAKHFVAAFLDLVFDGPDQRAGIDLCHRVKTEAPHSAGRVSALIVVSGSTRPVERVRATLAGSDAFLSKPVTRGSVAQALEACGVALPSDSRRV
ncbi:MAG: response regulator [Pseudomonadota bacterium]|nr:response regulator [Pseudomonadota bacterium]